MICIHSMIEPCAACAHLRGQTPDGNELRALRAVADAARDCLARWEGGACIVDPACGDCAACRLVAALAALKETT